MPCSYYKSSEIIQDATRAIRVIHVRDINCINCSHTSSVFDKETSLLIYITRYALIIFANDVILCLKTIIMSTQIARS